MKSELLNAKRNEGVHFPDVFDVFVLRLIRLSQK